MYVYVDDKKTIPSGYFIARSYEETKKYLKSGQVELISLDYNLGEGKKNGYDIVELICKLGLKIDTIYIHAPKEEEEGKKEMYRRLKEGIKKGEIAVKNIYTTI